MIGLRRDGHLNDLALEHAATGVPLPATVEHLSSCDSCQARLDAALQVELPDLGELPELQALLGANLPAPPEPSLPQPANRPWMWGVLLTAASAAVAAMIAIHTGTDDGLRIKGAGLHLEVFLDRGQTSTRLRNGDPVSAGDRLGFRVRSRESGNLMIIGFDGASEAYLCYPQSTRGRSTQVAATLEPIALPEAVRMDDTPGTEQLLAILCEEPFTYDAIVGTLVEDALPPGCITDEITLEKP